MGTIAKIFLIIILALAGVVLYTLRLASGIKVTFGLTYLDLSKLGSITSLAQGASLIKVGLRLCIVNPLSYSISIKDLSYELYHKGVQVATSSVDNPSLKKINIAANKETCFETGTDFTVNPALVSLVYNLKTKEITTIEYVIRGKMFSFIPFTKKGTYTA